MLAGNRQQPWLAEPVAPGCRTIAAKFAHGVLHEATATTGRVLAECGSDQPARSAPLT